MLILKILRKYLLVFVLCLVSALHIVLPVQCLEIENNVITDLTNEEGEIIGIVYDGGQENYEYQKYIFPVLQITIQRDGKEIQLEDKLKLNIYNYNLTTNEEIYLQKVDWDGQNNYFIFNPDGYAKGQTFKFKLLAYDEEGQEKEYELEKSIIKFSRYGELKKLQLTLTTSDPEAGGGNDTGILATLKNIFTSITNFFGNFFSLLAQFVKETITMLFVPPDNMMDIITKDLYARTIENIPILDLPIQFLYNFIEGKSEYWVGKSCGLSWSQIEFMNTIVFPGGSINFVDFIENNKTLNELHNYYYIISNGILGIGFIGYLNKKFNQVFN